MRSVSLKEFVADLAGWCAVAEHEAIALIEGGTEVFIVLPIADFQRLAALAGKQSAKPAHE